MAYATVTARSPLATDRAERNGRYRVIQNNGVEGISVQKIYFTKYTCK
jgi:hypothetical protein